MYLRWCTDHDLEAMIATARTSTNPNDFALVAMLGLLGLRIFEATGASIGDRVAGPMLCNQVGGRMDRHAATRRLKHLAAAAGVRMSRMHSHMLRHTFVTTMLDTGVPLRDAQIAGRYADPRTTMRYDRARTNRDRHPHYIFAAFMASGT
ncbi:MAG: site-specific integrase [Dactylosporangium sp.]|nr:site-specific integrase [Dactylosporangium sp.]